MTEKERYATIGTWVEVLQREGVSVCRETLRTRLKAEKVIGETARSRRGNVIHEGFYEESDVRRAIADLLLSVPCADLNNEIEMNGERYVTIGGLSAKYKICEKAIESRIRKTSIQSIRGRSRSGHLDDFYSISQIFQSCGDLFHPYPKANDEGFIEAEDGKYGTLKAISVRLGITLDGIQPRMTGKNVKMIKGKDKGNNLRDFYSLSEVSALCADITAVMPQTDEDGLIRIGGEIYGTSYSLSKILSLSPTTIRKKLQISSLQSVRGKDKVGRVHHFYRLADVRQLCGVRDERLPVADEHGFFQRDDEIYGTIRSISKRIGVSTNAIITRMECANLQVRRGLDSSNNEQSFYMLSEVRHLCADLLCDLPQADEDGFFQLNGETFGTIFSFSKLFGVVHRTVGRRIVQGNLTAVKGRDGRRTLKDFYPMSQVRLLCADLIAKRKKE